MNKRQNAIYEFIKDNPGSTRSAVADYISKIHPGKNSRPTILRDIDLLLTEEKIHKSGSGRGTVYFANIDVEAYFAIEPDKRKLKSENFNFDIWADIRNMLNSNELAELDLLNEQYRKNISELSPASLKREIERLTIEFAWKSSKIEGNTYTLLDTERLIKEKIEAEGNDKSEAIMILNHKTAVDFIFDQPKLFENLTAAKIEHVHKLLTGDLEIGAGIRRKRIGITGTNYSPLDNQFQIKEALEKLTSFINELKHPLEKALAAVLMISYIQPFEDGNKRTARTIGNAILLAFNYCPLSYRSVDEIEYKKGMLLFYEQNDFKYFRKIFTEQFKMAVEKYF
uniref:Fido domain-containing protein n=1 Tax=uncultured bacterium contig00078 TaxID=1181556 RepID=A0A806KNV1_9BACT|nr:hypothetical protein [uncultured bacterium contig00078]